MTAHRFAANSNAIPKPGSRQFHRATGPLAGFGVVAALSAIAGSSCCVLPLVLAGLGAGSATFGGIAFLTDHQPYSLGAAALLIAGAWTEFWRRSRASACSAGTACAREKPSHRTIALLCVATAFVGLAAAWGFVEPILLRAIG